VNKILFVTGTRADFGKLEPLAKAAISAGYRVGFFVTGMHMMHKYGGTSWEVKNVDGAEIFEFVNQKEGDSLDSILSKTIVGFSDFVHEHRPDLVIVHGDRIEATAVSLVCATNYIYSAHIEGGEISGTIDESLRHCNTKLCSTHFVSSKEAAARVSRLGEPSERIYVIGSPELDSHLNPSGVDIKEVKKRYEILFEDYAIVIFHPVTSERRSMSVQAADLYAALMHSGRNFVVIAPNNDPGSSDLFKILNGLPRERFRIIPSMRFNYFSELMKNASLIIGNSSAGVREAPFIGIPSIDIGSRQNNRASNESIIHCAASDTDKLLELLSSSFWGNRYQSATQFGEGRTSSKFIEVLSTHEFWAHSIQKSFSD
jgi:UDP-N-acetylglucosamine 2-epimerase (hydrolysing)